MQGYILFPKARADKLKTFATFAMTFAEMFCNRYMVAVCKGYYIGVAICKRSIPVNLNNGRTS